MRDVSMVDFFATQTHNSYLFDIITLCQEVVRVIKRSRYFLMTVLYDILEFHHGLKQTIGYTIPLARSSLAFSKVRFGSSYTVSVAKSVNSHEQATYR